MNKKQLFILICFFLSTSSVFSQEGGVSIGKGREVAHGKAILELVSNTKGFLVPRLTTINRLAMFPDADFTALGLMVFDTDEKIFFFWEGNDWGKINRKNINFGDVLPSVSEVVTGELFYDSSTQFMYIFDGVKWAQVNPVRLSDILKRDGGNDADGLRIINLGAPTDAGDAATKAYVDNLAFLTGNSDMLRSVYDINLDGVVDNAATVNNLSVEKAVPADAVFTDQQTLKNVLANGNDANAMSIHNLAEPVEQSDAVTKAYVDKGLVDYEKIANKNIADGYVGLDKDIKIKSKYLPSAINLKSVYTIAYAADLGSIILPPDVSEVVIGDMVICTEEAATFVYATNELGINTWIAIKNPDDVVMSVNGEIGDVILTAAHIGLEKVDNTTDLDKPLSTASKTYIDEHNVQADWNQIDVTALDYVRNKPAINAEANLFYGVLSDLTASTEDELLALTTVDSKNGEISISYETKGLDKYFSLAIPATWRQPFLKIGDDETLMVLNPTQNINMNSIEYIVWQVDIKLPAGIMVHVR
jgi:hypothetical protein